MNRFITLQNVTDKNSSVSINDKMIDEKNIIEETLSHQNLSEIIDRKYDDNEINLLNTE